MHPQKRCKWPAITWRQSSVLSDYQNLRPLFRLLRPLRGLYVAGADIGKAMIVAARDGLRGRILDNREIRRLADRSGL